MRQRKREIPDRDQLVHSLKNMLPELRERYGVRTLGLFGSYVHEAARKGSDIDLLVEFDRTPSLLKFIELEQHLSDLFGVKVDLVMRSALKPAIGRRILEEVLSI